MPRDAITNHQSIGRDMGTRLRNPIEGAATAWETFFRAAFRKKFRGELGLGRASDRNSMILVGGW
jgi:hypothetical protein